MLKADLTESERKDFASVVENNLFTVEPAHDRTNWGTFPIVRVRNDLNGRSGTYYRWSPSHPLYWVRRFADDFTAGKFA
jgi:hypothetical protein